MATYERIDYGSDDGCQIGGAATDKIGFYGATPVARIANVVDATDAATAITKLNAVIAGLESLGLFASS